MRIDRAAVQRLRLGVVCFALLLAGLAVLAPAASAGEWIFSGSDFSSGSQPQVAMNAAGETIAVFVGYGPRIRASVRGIGGQFSGGVFGEAVSGEDGLWVEAPDVAIDSAGDIVVVWQQGEGPSRSRIYASFRPAGGSFGTPVPISATGASAPAVAMDAGGDATVVWLLDDGSNEIVQAASGRGGSFSAPVALSGDGGNASSAAVAMNPAGDAVASWMRDDAGVTKLEDGVVRAGGSFPAPDGQGDGSITGEAESVSTVKPAEPLVQQQVVMGGHGEALAVWRAPGGEVRIARLGTHGSAFGVPVTLGSSTARPSVAMNESGEAVVGWPVTLGVEVATASAGGVFGAPAYLATVLGRSPKVANLAIAPYGAVAMAWVDAREASNGEISGEVGEEGVTRPPGGTFSAPRGVFSGGYRLGVGSLELASDAQGDVFGMWQENTIIGDDVVAMTYDNGPVIGTVSAPTSGQTGQSLSFSIPPPVSVWKPVKAVTWDFGDGTTGSGLSTTHTYTQPGVYTVTVTASDDQSLPFRVNPEYVQTSVTRTVTITSQPNAAPSPGVVARSAPTITGASQSHNVWREGRGLARMSRNRRQPPIGTTFSFSVNEDVRVSLVFTQVVGGRKVKGKCIAQTRQNRESRSCKRTVTRGTLSFGTAPGRNNLAFQGRVSRRSSLKPGRYLMTITAVNTAGERSSPISLAFTIVK